MNSTQTAEPNHPPLPGRASPDRSLWVLLVLGVLVSLFAISAQSFWLDEAGTAYKALQPSLSAWWDAMRAESNSNLQLPLYLVYAWAWEKLVGHGEFALRLGNAPWFLLGLLVMARALPAGRLRWGVAIALLTSPFAWYYLDDARPYSVQLGASLLVFASFYRLGQTPGLPGERRWAIALGAGSVLLSVSGMLAMLWLGAYFLAALLSTPKQVWTGLLARQKYVLAVTFPLLFAIGLYYLWTLTLGARASSVGGTDIKNLFFIVYELLGFSGLGPGRLAIRNEGLSAFKPWIPFLTLYTALLLALLTVSCRALAKGPPRLWWPLAFLGVAAFLFAVGITVQFRLLGRHCTPLLPPLLFLLGSGLASLFERPRLSAHALAAAFLAISLVSCFGLRFGQHHAKDDYRAAAQLARQALARGQTVWWNADQQGAFVYEVPLSKTPKPSAALLIEPNPILTDLPSPDLVLASKPDIYDPSGTLRQHLLKEDLKPESSLMAFTIWRKARE